MPTVSLLVFKEGLQDLAALKLLEGYIGREKTVELIEETLGEEIRFDRCFSADRILAMRRAVDEKIRILAEKP